MTGNARPDGLISNVWRSSDSIHSKLSCERRKAVFEVACLVLQKCRSRSAPMFSSKEKLSLAALDLPFIVKDGLFDDIAEAVHEEVRQFYSSDRAEFQRAGVGDAQRAAIVDERADLRVWLSPALCESRNLKAVAALVKCSFSWCKELKAPLALNAEYSVQLTCYPGNGARYVRHRDAFVPAADGGTPQRAGHRKLTLIFYLNKTWEGGCLRAHFSGQQSKVDANHPPYLDVEPKLGRLVVFRGDIVEHEVLPSFADRFAISVWAYSSSPPLSLSAPLPAISSTPRSLPLSTFLPCTQPHRASPPPLPTPSHALVDKTIFVSMANYRDSEGLRTIVHLFLTARCPQRVFVGHVFQGEDGEDSLADVSSLPLEGLEDREVLQCLKSPHHVRTLRLHSQQATGPCLARHLAQKLWKQEDFLLQIDSHMRFRRHWDDYLIALWEDIVRLEGDRQPVLTTYPPSYTLPEEKLEDVRATVLRPWKFGPDGLLRQRGHSVALSSHPEGEGMDSPLLYYRSPLWASGFSFSSSQLLVDVEYSPHLPEAFFGEESLLAARLVTSGYTLYAPGQAVCYHLYSRDHRPVFSHRSEQDERDERMAGRLSKTRLKAVSQQVIRRLLEGPGVEMDADTEAACRRNRAYGLGDQRTLQDFEQIAGVQWSRHHLSRSDEDWLAFITDTAPLRNLRQRGVEARVAGSVDAQEEAQLVALQHILSPTAASGLDANILSTLRRFLS